MQAKCGLFFTSYAQESRIFKTGFQRICLSLFMLALVVSPYFLDQYYVSILNLINIAVIGAVSLNLLTGCCGQISLGHGAFVGVGAYASALTAQAGFPFPMALAAGGAVAAITGMVFGLPSLRLKGIYLAISTLPSPPIIIMAR